MLLEKKLDEFVKEFDALYTVRDSVPAYYRQALYLHAQMHGTATDSIADEDMDTLWSQYMEKKEELTGHKGEANWMRKQFGDTYWWYYQYK